MSNGIQFSIQAIPDEDGSYPTDAIEITYWDSYSGDDRHLILHDNGTCEELLGYTEDDQPIFETVLSLANRLKEILHEIEEKENN